MAAAHIITLVETLKAEFEKVSRIPADKADALLALLDKAPREALELIVQHRVKFCYLPATRRLEQKFGMKVNLTTSPATITRA